MHVDLLQSCAVAPIKEVAALISQCSSGSFIIFDRFRHGIAIQVNPFSFQTPTAACPGVADVDERLLDQKVGLGVLDGLGHFRLGTTCTTFDILFLYLDRPHTSQRLVGSRSIFLRIVGLPMAA